ncbi:MAG TPA: maleylpyruvate isomerase family mycothiol-dependent enzyme [Actinomycetota bacterium]|nr:maleylpyruvate isomerase family mycothiol-dependent enzyme [Actinomycetota bacterium]
MNKDEIVRAIRDERRRTLTLLRRLEPEQLDLPTALPGWRLREVIAHLITTDKASVTGANLLTVLGSMERLERWNERQVPRWADRPIPELLMGLDRWGRGMTRLARTLPTALYRLTLPTIFGRAPVGLLIWSRVYDEWIHRQDMRRALGLPDEEVDVESPSEFLLTAIVFAVLPNLEGAAGDIGVSLEGAPVPPWRYDLAAGSGAPSERPSDAAARIAGPAPSFIMAAAGRDTFDALRLDGLLEVEGDREFAARFLATLRVV